MRTDGSEEKGDVEDRRGMSKNTKIGGGIAAVVIGLIATYVGINPAVLQQFLGGNPPVEQGPANPPADGYKEFAEDLIGMNNGVWEKVFADPRNGYRVRYERPRMVLFDTAVDTDGCGKGIPSGVGPFYCPADRRVYLDPTFFAELEKLGGANQKAKFSQAYVIAHEVGHHVQNLLEYNAKAEHAKFGRDGFRKEDDNAGIRLELQADYLAGVWARHAQDRYKILESPSEVEDALTTASAIGDNKLTKGRVPSEKFNHGRDDQRYYFFKRGFETGNATKEYLDKFFNPKIDPLKIGPGSGF